MNSYQTTGNSVFKISCISLAVSLCGLVCGAETRAAVPPDGRIVLSDPGLRDWGPELVHYTVNTQVFVPGKLALTGPDGKAVPFQVDGDTLAAETA
jgi:hypothetical protein